MRCNDKLVLAAGHANPFKLVAFVNAYGGKAALAHVAVSGKAGTLDNALLCNHGKVGVFVVDYAADFNHGGYFFILLDLQQVDYVRAARRALAFGNFIALYAEHSALAGKEENKVVSGRHKQVFHKVLVTAGHAGNTSAAAALRLIGIHGLTLDISEMSKCNNSVLHGDKILNIHFSADGFNGGAAVVAEFVGNFFDFGLDNVVNQMNIPKDCFQFFNPLCNITQFVFNLLHIKCGKTAKAHGKNCVRLNFRKTEALHKARTVFVVVAAGTDYVNNLVNIILGDFIAFQYVLAFLRLAKVKAGAAGNDFALEVNVVLKNFLKGEYLRLTVNQCKHDNAHGILKLGVGKELIEHHLGVRFALKLDDNTQTLAVGFVAQVGNSFYALFLYKVCYAFNKTGFVNAVGNLAYNYAVTVVFPFLNFCAGTKGDFCSAGGICRADSGSAHNNAAGGEVRPFYVLHKLVKGSVRVVDKAANRVRGFAKVMGRNVRRHTYGDAHASVHQKAGEAGGKHHRLFKAVVIVRHKVDGVFINIREHFGCHFAHTAFGITVCGGRVAVN